MFKKKIGNIPKAIGSLSAGSFFTAIAISYADNSNWLIAGILGFIAFCGYVSSYHFFDLEAKEEIKQQVTSS